MAKKKTNGNVTKSGGSGKPSAQQKAIKPRGCDATPGSKACAKTRSKGGMYCKSCTAWRHVGKGA